MSQPKVRVIKGTAVQPARRTQPQEPVREKKRVCAYCRVSTDHEDQERRSRRISTH